MDVLDNTGIYIAYPTSSVMKSIYRQKNYITKVNHLHTKIGIARDSFAARRMGYVRNFDGEVKFLPIVHIEGGHLKEAEKAVIAAIRAKYNRVGKAREWFDTSDRERVKEIVFKTLTMIQCPHLRVV